MSPLLQALLKQAEQLAPEERLELIQGLAEQMKSHLLEPNRQHRLSEFRGLAPNLLGDKDAQEWVSELRNEWKDRERQIFEGL